MSADLSARLIARLDACPCCSAGVAETNLPKDGIPDDTVFEALFRCGAAVFVTTNDDYRVGRQACPSAMDRALNALQSQVEDEADDEDDENEDAEPADSDVA